MATEPAVWVLYGSDTGTAVEVSECIGRQLRLHNVRCEVAAADANPVSEWGSFCQQDGPRVSRVVLFVVATAGQGDMPKTIQGTWDTLRRKSCPSFPGLHYGVFGLGDSSYSETFNFAGKKLYRRLEQLEGVPIMGYGLGDDMDELGLDTQLQPWLATILHVLIGEAPPPPKEGAPTFSPHEGVSIPLLTEEVVGAASLSPPRRLLDCPWGVSVCPTPGSATESAWPEIIHNEATHLAVLQKKHRATAPDHFQTTYHMDFEFLWEPPHYEPGDVVGFTPPTPDAVVAALAERTGWDLGWMVKIEPGSGEGKGSLDVVDSVAPDSYPAISYRNHQLGGRWLTLRELFTRHLDLCHPPTRAFFEDLSFFTTNAEEEEKLTFFGSSEGAAEVTEYCKRERRTHVEVLQDFPEVVTMGGEESGAGRFEFLRRFISLVPPIQPRMYSIASSQAVSPKGFSVLVALVNYQTPWKRKRRGLASRWFDGMVEGDSTRVIIQKGGISLPKLPRGTPAESADSLPSLATPVILYGPGTGVAPFRAFLQHRAAIHRANACRAGPGGAPAPSTSILFFGCRSPMLDLYFNEDWKKLEEESASSGGSFDFKLRTAFSRPTAEDWNVNKIEKNYVHHVASKVENAVTVRNLILDQNAHVYIAGNAKSMPKDVMEGLKRIFENQGMSDSDSDSYVKMLKRTGRLQLDTW